MATRTFRAPTISCEHCVRTIERELGDLPGVTAARVDLAAKTVAVEWDETRTTWDDIRRLMTDVGYPPAEV